MADYAARAAYECHAMRIFGCAPAPVTISKTGPTKAQSTPVPWTDLDEGTRDMWRQIARAVREAERIHSLATVTPPTTTKPPLVVAEVIRP